MNEIAPPPPEKDRSVGLTVFGIFTILLGLGAALMGVVSIFSLAMMSGRPEVGVPTSSLWPAVAFYLGGAVVTIWLGIGSILKRRWARALLLMGSWTGLFVGLLTIVSMAFMWSSLFSPESMPGIPESQIWIVALIPILFLFVLFIVLPAIWVFFYGSRHVKATCEFADPVVRWTDARPLPLLACVIWLAVGGVGCAIMAITGPAVIPLFGTFLAGWPAHLVLALFALIWAYGTRGFYRREMAAWWTMTVIVVLFAVSSIITYSVRDIMEIYPLMGYSSEQIALIAKTNVMKGSFTTWSVVFWTLPSLGYLLFVRRYFMTRTMA